MSYFWLKIFTKGTYTTINYLFIGKIFAKQLYINPSLMT